jgi:hypothetical protein
MRMTGPGRFSLLKPSKWVTRRRPKIDRIVDAREGRHFRGKLMFKVR